MSKFNGFILSFSASNKCLLLVYMVIINIVITFSISLAVTMIKGDSVLEIEFLMEKSLFDIFFIAVIFSPFFETLIFQFLIIELVLFLCKKFSISKSMYVAVLISGISFGLSHSYNVYYVLFTVLMGLLFAVFYLIAKNHKNMSAFMTVCIVHSSSNLVGFIVDDWLNLM